MKSIEEVMDENQRLKKILVHLVPEKSGRYFICGQGGEVDENGLPDSIFVCPAYGADMMTIYKKTEKMDGPAW